MSEHPFDDDEVSGDAGPHDNVAAFMPARGRPPRDAPGTGGTVIPFDTTRTRHPRTRVAPAEPIPSGGKSLDAGAPDELMPDTVAPGMTPHTVMPGTVASGAAASGAEVLDPEGREAVAVFDDDTDDVDEFGFEAEGSGYDPDEFADAEPSVAFHATESVTATEIRARAADASAGVGPLASLRIRTPAADGPVDGTAGATSAERSRGGSPSADSTTGLRGAGAAPGTASRERARPVERVDGDRHSADEAPGHRATPPMHARRTGPCRAANDRAGDDRAEKGHAGKDRTDLERASSDRDEASRAARKTDQGDPAGPDRAASERSAAAEHAEVQAWADPVRISFAGTAATVGAHAARAELDAIIADAEQDLLRALRRSDRSRAEARVLLEAHDELGEGHIEDLLDRMTDLGYLDDERLAESLVERLTRKGQGPLVVRRTLRERCIDDAAIERALEALDGDDEDARAFELAAARATRLRGVEPTAARRRLVSYLQRRGFDGAMSMRAADAALQGGTAGGRRDRRTGGVYFGNAD